MRFGIDADDGFSVAFTQVYPFVREVDFNTVDVSNVILREAFFYLIQYRIDIDFRCELYLLLRNEIRRIGCTQFACFHFLFSQMREEKSDAYESVASIVAGRIDNSAIAFAANDGICSFHLGYNINLAYSGSGIFATRIAMRYVAQGTARGKIADRIARRMTQDVVADSNKRILFTEHLAVFTDDGKTVHIRINYEADVSFR